MNNDLLFTQLIIIINNNTKYRFPIWAIYIIRDISLHWLHKKSRGGLAIEITNNKLRIINLVCLVLKNVNYMLAQWSKFFSSVNRNIIKPFSGTRIETQVTD